MLVLLVLLLLPFLLPLCLVAYAASLYGTGNVGRYCQYRFSHDAVWFPFCYLPQEERIKQLETENDDLTIGLGDGHPLPR